MSIKQSPIFVLILSALAAVLAACTTPTPPKDYPPNPDFLIAIPAFGEGGAIPARYTCSGENVSPAIQFTKVPAGAQSLALVVEDPDAPGVSSSTG